MNPEFAPEAKKDRSSVIFQILAALFGFLAVVSVPEARVLELTAASFGPLFFVFITGGTLLFAALSSAASCSDYLSHRKWYCFLGSTLGSAAGLILALTGGDPVRRISLDAKIFGRDIELLLDIVTLSVAAFVLIPALSAVFCLCVSKRASRGVCVACSTGVVLLCQFAVIGILFYQRYRTLSPELLRDKMSLLVRLSEYFISTQLENVNFSPEISDAIVSGALGMVYSLPSYFALLGGVCAFIHSFFVKTALRLNGTLGFIYTDGWALVPGIVSAVVYVILYIATFIIGLFTDDAVTYYALNVITVLLSGAFFVAGLTAFRRLGELRKKSSPYPGSGFFGKALLVVGAVLMPSAAVFIVCLAGVAYSVFRELKRKNQNSPS